MNNSKICKANNEIIYYLNLYPVNAFNPIDYIAWKLTTLFVAVIRKMAVEIRCTASKQNKHLNPIRKRLPLLAKAIMITNNLVTHLALK